MPTPPGSPLSEVLTSRRLRKLASGASFQRGIEYCATGRVSSLVSRDGGLSATVTKVRALLSANGRGDVWKTAIDRLRLTHTAKRNFIALAAEL